MDSLSSFLCGYIHCPSLFPEILDRLDKPAKHLLRALLATGDYQGGQMEGKASTGGMTFTVNLLQLNLLATYRVNLLLVAGVFSLRPPHVLRGITVLPAVALPGEYA